MQRAEEVHWTQGRSGKEHTLLIRDNPEYCWGWCHGGYITWRIHNQIKCIILKLHQKKNILQNNNEVKHIESANEKETFQSLIDAPAVDNKENIIPPQIHFISRGSSHIHCKCDSKDTWLHGAIFHSKLQSFSYHLRVLCILLNYIYSYLFLVLSLMW